MTTEVNRLNGVNLVAVSELIAAIGEDPTVADTVWAAAVEWTGGFASEVKVREHAVFLSDEPAVLPGTDDRAFCERVSRPREHGYRHYGSPAITVRGDEIVVVQAVTLDQTDEGTGP